VRLRPAEREHFLSALAEDWPEEVERYEALFATRASLPAELTKPILEHVRSLTRETPSPTRSRRPERQRRRHAEQLTLAV
jgi:hypothetical protein